MWIKGGRLANHAPEPEYGRIMTPIPASCLEPANAARIAMIAHSHARLMGRPLVDPGEDVVGAMWHAPLAIVAHGTEADPVFFFGNAAALRAFECDFAAFTAMPSRLSAEAPDRAERSRLLERVSRDGFIEDYAGIRVSATGRRFAIERATVWNLVDEAGGYHGQAACFLP